MRRILVHVKGLPPDSALHRKLEPWTQDHELLATVVDSLARLEYAYVKVNGGDSEQPKPFPRPEVEGREAPAAPTVSISQFAAMLSREPNG